MISILKSTPRLIKKHGIKWRSKTLIDVDYAEDFSILDERSF